jgi:hypothetical protein
MFSFTDGGSRVLQLPNCLHWQWDHHPPTIF